AAPAGVRVTETRLTRLSSAPEIAQAMLRQQQASAVVGARQRIVEGAVGMVRLALERLAEEGVVELDEERKAAMVSNLLVVLCSEQATQQVVNTGSLYQYPGARQASERTQECPAASRPGRSRRPRPMGRRRAAQHQRPDRVPAPPRARRRGADA